MTEKLRLTCIVCPMSCGLEVTVSGAGQLRRVDAVTGNTCRRGADYAAAEVTCPKRTLTSTVAIQGAPVARLPVRTRTEIPRTLISEAVQEIARVTVKAPIKVGQIILADVAGSGVDLVASCDMPGPGA